MTGLFRPIGWHSETRGVPNSNRSLSPFTVFSNASQAGMNVRFEAAADVDLVFEK
jgi:hypothetical protein